MSYLVDALKKAERERYSRQAQHANSLAMEPGPAAVAPRTSGPLIWLVAILVASNVALAIYVWRPRSAHSAPAVPMAAAQSLARIQQPSAAPASGFSMPGTEHGSTASAAVSRPPAPTPNVGRTAGATPSSPAGSARQNAETADAGAANHAKTSGHVTYSKTPLTGAGTGASAGPVGNSDGGSRDSGGANTPDQSDLDNVPSVQINGQLYSTVPGRSFILVNGRRYHEGERLAAGPAVESIGPNGATLRYHGQRYHVPGPG